MTWVKYGIRFSWTDPSKLRRGSRRRDANNRLDSEGNGHPQSWQELKHYLEFLSNEQTSADWQLPDAELESGGVRGANFQVCLHHCELDKIRVQETPARVHQSVLAEKWRI